eukprot:2929239-Prymnesium_polylepis.1
MPFSPRLAQLTAATLAAFTRASAREAREAMPWLKTQYTCVYAGHGLQVLTTFITDPVHPHETT